MGLHLRGSCGQCSPIDAGEDIVNKLRVGFNGVGYQFAVFWVEGKGGRGAFAGFDGAGEEVKCEDLHCYCPDVKFFGKVLGVW